MKKIHNIITTALFLSALFVTPLCLFLSSDNEFSENENRYLAQKPKFSLDALFSGKFMENTEKYVDDQFPLRDFWTAAKSDIAQFIGNKEVNGVYLGADGYLIEKWADSDFNEAQLDQNITALNTFAENHSDLKTSVMIVPTAGLVLSEKLPENAPMFDQNIAFDKIGNELSGAEYFDLREIMLNHRRQAVFYKTDHHWTTFGAFLGYSAWCEKDGITVDGLDFDVESVSDTFQGSLYSKVLSSDCAMDELVLFHWKEQGDYTVEYNFGKTTSDSVYARENLDKKDKYLVFLNGNHPEVTITTSQTNGKHLLVLKDSFANAFIPFLLNDYESIHVIDMRYFNADIDTYITENEITETLFLYNIKNFCEDDNLKKLTF